MGMGRAIEIMIQMAAEEDEWETEDEEEYYE